jgi:NADH-quinone oxidoreductase subunit N
MSTPEFVFTAADARALMPVWILTGTALIALVVDLFARRRGASFSGWLSLIGIVAAGVALWAVREESRLIFSGTVVFDPFGIFFTGLFLVVAFVSVLFSWDYIKRIEIFRAEYYVLLLLSTLGMIFMAIANDLIVIFLGLELMSLSLYVLAGFRRTRIESTEAAMKYFLLGAFASGFLLYGIAYLYGATGTTNLSRMNAILIESPLAGNAFLILGALLLLVGFAFKVSAVPFHMWTPDAYQGAPTSVTAFMSAGAKAAGFAALVRVLSQALALADVDWSMLGQWVAIATMVVGNVVAILQNNLKRMLAYSSIAHAGYVLVGILAGGADGYSAVLFYLVVYSILSLGAFGALTLLGRGHDERLDVSEMGGIGRRNPILAMIFALFMFGLAGIPPTAGFIGKLYLFRAAIEAGFVPLVIIAVLASVASVYYYLRPIVVMYMMEPKGAPVEISRSWAAGVALLVAAVLAIWLGVQPGALADTAMASVLGMFP